MSKAKQSPRKFSEKIALLNKKEAEATAAFEKIIKEVEETTRAPPTTLFQAPYWPQARSASFSSWQGFQEQQQQILENHHHHQQQQYVVNQSVSPDSTYLANSSSPHQRRHQQLDNLTTSGHNGTNTIHNAATAPVGVPNIAIFPTDDGNYQRQQQVTTTVTTAAAAASTVTTAACNTSQQNNINQSYRNDCSMNSSISSARSLPNIANLNVSGTTPCQLGPAYSQQRLAPTVTTTPTTTHTNNTNQNLQPAFDVNVNYDTTTNNSNLLCANDDVQQHDYCSLPPQPFLNQQQQSGPPPNNGHQQNIGANHWQPIVTTNATTTNTNNFTHTTNNQPQQQQQRLHTNSPQSPQTIQQNYYQTTQNNSPNQLHGSASNTMVRANSTNVISSWQNTDLLDTPAINNQLSKSSEACYGYLDNYELSGNVYTGPGFSSPQGANSQDSSTSNPMMRSHSDNNIETMDTQNDTNELTSTPPTITCYEEPQRFLETPQYQFYG